MRRLHIAASVAVSLLVMSPFAAADESARTPGAADTTAQPPKSADSTEDAYASYQKGDFVSAIANYKKAYSETSDIRIMFNIATIYDKKLHDRELAEEYYRRYVLFPDAEPDLLRRAHERLSAIKEEKESLQRSARGSAPPAAPAPPADHGANQATTSSSSAGSPSKAFRVAGLITGGVGVVALGAGVFLGLTAKSKNDEAASLCPNNVCRDSNGIGLTDTAKTNATWSTVSMIGGGVLLAAGAALFIAAPSEKSATARLRFVPDVNRSYVGLSMGANWR